jgi:hypothetical protein
MQKGACRVEKLGKLDGIPGFISTVLRGEPRKLSAPRWMRRRETRAGP